jgi:parallel beta-helix repeat protein
MARGIWLAIIAASLWGQAFALSDWSTVAQRAKNSVVKVIARTKKGEATGTGFAVSADGKIATNYHVIESASKIFVKLPNGRTVGIERVVAFDKRVDLAILQVRGITLRPLPLGDSNAVKVGQEVCVMGSPLGLEQSFSTGVVSAKRVMDGFEWIQITAPISPGNSGSPVMTRSGRVIGVATFGYEKGQNLNFASSVKYLRMLLNRQPIRPERPSAQPPQEPPVPQEPPAPQEPPSSMLVTNAEELVRAIQEIKEGGEITLQPGEYRLRSILSFYKSLTIAGAGYEETVIVYEGSGSELIWFTGSGLLSIRDVSLRYSGSAKLPVVIRASGELRLTRCLVSGGVGKDDKYIGAGIVVDENARAVISECLIVDNEAGVIVSPKAEARVEFCKFIANADPGLIVRGACEVRHSEFLRNLKHGIYADGEGRLIARNNTCEGNKYSGIALLGSAQGEIEGNTCRNNGLHGIGAQDQSRLVARNNTCEGNKQGGIGLLGSAQGEVSGNACRNNGYHGIAAQEQSRLVARNNTCEGNEMSGIALFDSVQGEIEGNQCANNKLNGIYIHERSVKATLRNNTVYGNRGGDIYDPRR